MNMERDPEPDTQHRKELGKRPPGTPRSDSEPEAVSDLQFSRNSSLYCRGSAIKNKLTLKSPVGI